MPTPEPPGAFLAGFMDDYFAECDEHLTEIRRILVGTDPTSGGRLTAASLEELFRGFHTIKGLSGMVELREAELLAHELEAQLRPLRAGDAQFTSRALDAMLEGTQALERVIGARREQQPIPPINDALAALRMSGAMDTVPVDPPAQSETGTRWRATFTPSTELAGRGINVDYVRRLLRDSAHIVDAAPRIAADGAITFEFTLTELQDPALREGWAADGIVLTELPAGTSTEAAAPAPPRAASAPMLTPSQFVRVDLSRLDDLMRMIGDLVITRARMGESLSDLENHVPPLAWRAIQENGLALERQLRDLREGVMRLRLIPVGEIFRRMSLAVRDLARDSGKKVDIDIRGQHTEVDKYLVERMMDPVLHLVRNAVSHGIDTPAARLARGKPEAGRLTMSATTVGDLVTLEIADDGEGVAVEAVASRARTAGLAVPDGALEGPPLLEILCAPGFSTRDAADLAAGRGVGMGVVQATVRELGGTLEIDTAPGQGTRFIMQLPVSLAIADALIASVGAQTFAVPQSSVREVIEVEPASIRSLENHEVAPHRGGILPLLRLSVLFGIEPQPHRTLHVFVVGQGHSALGIVVDRIRGQREVVVRPMADPLIKVEGVSGATDLGDGRVVLILDTARLARVRAAAAPARLSHVPWVRS